MSKFYRVMYILFAGIVRFFMRIHIHGGENEPEKNSGAFVVCANHISASDPVSVCAALRKHQPHWMAKKELFKIPLLNLLIKALGAYPINRSGDVSAIKNSIKMLEDGKVVGIFPQGHRNPGVDPKTTPVKNGIALVATHANCPVLPVYIKMKDDKPGIFRRRDVIIGKQISPEELAYDPEKSGEYARISAYIFDKICELRDQNTN